jgi:hypothetical protein
VFQKRIVLGERTILGTSSPSCDSGIRKDEERKNKENKNAFIFRLSLSS